MHSRKTLADAQRPSISSKFWASTLMQNSIIQAETLMMGFLVEHNFPTAAFNHLLKLTYRV